MVRTGPTFEKRERDRWFAVPRCWRRGYSNCRSCSLHYLIDDRQGAERRKLLQVVAIPVGRDRVRQLNRRFDEFCPALPFHRSGGVLCPLCGNEIARMMEQDRLLRGRGSAAAGGAPLPLLRDGCRLCSFAPFVGIPRRYPNPSTLHMQILQVSPTEPATVSALSECLPH